MLAKTKEDLISSIIQPSRHTLTTGVELCLIPLTIEAFELIQRRNDPPPSDSSFLLDALVCSIVHPETHEYLLTFDDLPQLRQLSMRDLEKLGQAINSLNGMLPEAEEPDPVKKPALGLADNGTFSTDSLSTGDAPPPDLPSTSRSTI